MLNTNNKLNFIYLLFYLTLNDIKGIIKSYGSFFIFLFLYL